MDVTCFNFSLKRTDHEYGMLLTLLFFCFLGQEFRTLRMSDTQRRKVDRLGIPWKQCHPFLIDFLGPFPPVL